jgi:predicted Zn-dependent peptidase
MLALEDTLEQMLWIGETTITLDKIYSLEQIIREVNKVDIQDILETAKYIFKDRKMNLALIGPLKERDFNLADGFKLG